MRSEALEVEIDRRIQVEAELSDQLATESRRGAASDELFRLLVASVTDYAIFLLDLNGVVSTWNAGAERLKGYRADEIIGEHFSKFYLDADIRAGKCEHELETALATGRFEEEGWRLRKDGTTFWGSVVITCVRDDSGVPIGFAKVTRDLTEKKLDEARRISAEERFRLLVESVQDYALLILDTEGRIATWNAGAERIKGYTASEIVGTHFSRFYPAEDVAAGKCEYELEMATRDGRFEDENWRVRKDGSRFWANVVISAIRDRDGVLVGFSKVTRDLTERRRNEEERAARMAAEHASRAKDEFLAMLGHELRNPLAPIVTALQLIQMRGDSRGAKEYEVIERQVQHMTLLVDDLLDVSRISSGKVELKRSPTDLRDVIAKAVEISGPTLELRGHHLEIGVAAQPFVVDGDRARLTQVFTNLLNNAAKYTPANGHIFLGARREGSRIAVEVRDDGTGIPPDLLPRIFDLFVQGHQKVDRAAGGLGLGLTLVRSLVALHGGEVEAHSEGTGRGSTFIVRLPALEGVDVAAPGTMRRAVGAVGASRRILLVDDNEDARMLLADILGAVGHQVRAVGDGPTALAQVVELAPEVAILDIGLPVMDGYELAQKIRAALGDAAPRLIALTGYGQQSDRTRSADAGFDLHLVKPVDVQSLLKTLRDL